jgi:hypothetical protein
MGKQQRAAHNTTRERQKARNEKFILAKFAPWKNCLLLAGWLAGEFCAEEGKKEPKKNTNFLLLHECVLWQWRVSIFPPPARLLA